MMMLAQETFNAYNSFILLSVPFFLLTANLMSIGGITDRLVALSRAMVGHWPGSLAQINVVLSVFFAGISGSSTADAASQSKIFIDAQTKEGYDLSFSIAITAVSAVLAVIIPPSILMIVWGGLISTSIAAMYLAGIVPGLLIAGAQMADRACLCGPPRLSDLSEIQLGGDALRDLALDACADDALHHRRRHPARLVYRDGIRLRRGAVFRCAVDLLLPRNRPRRNCTRPCSTPGGWPGSRCSASAPQARSAGCWPITRFRRRCWRTSRPGAWDRSRRASSSRSAFWSSAAFSMPFRRS